MITVIYSLILKYDTDNTELLEGFGYSKQDIEEIHQIHWLTDVSSSLMGGVISFLFTFVVFMMISKFLNSDVTPKTILSASLSHSLIVTTVSLVVIVIQLALHLPAPAYIITSLNIFLPGNTYLAAFDVQTIFKGYVTFIVYYATSRLSLRASLILGLLTIVLIVLLALGSAFLEDTILSLAAEL
ncbi:MULTISPECIES: hypothetical protein [Staphylococcus]|uniref:Yip1 domain-containing protein n=1 Tax=Staphylococcus schleiferi TaxID=1295 RepID=A0A7Z7QNA5_STASC|nr:MULTISPECIES: hypothetical protein [Staphylococcus]EPD49093.1 hypothetical protein HMPREF1208_01870 [Staphylococcus sp. HGB0015]CAD7358793.1 Uncharacterised protein [Staphylococcus schleiferi]SUM86763.1 Uncharacterised protein [Staphylococcus schleiferi]